MLFLYLNEKVLQQSRFLALVSSYERLKELSETAADSEDAAQLQYLKTLDSIDAKTQQLQTSIQSLYVDTGLENWYKGAIDFGTNFVNMLNNLTTVAKAPVAAIATIGTTFYNLANIVTTVFNLIKTRLHAKSTQISSILSLNAQMTGASLTATAQMTEQQINASVDAMLSHFIADENTRKQIAQQTSAAIIKARQQQNSALVSGTNGSGTFSSRLSKHKGGLSVGLSAGSLLLSGISANTKNKQAQGWLGVGSTALSGAAMGAMIDPVIGTAIGAAGGIILGFVNNLSNIFQSAESKLKDLQEKAKEDSNEALTKKAQVKDLNKQIQQLRKLEAARYDSAEAEQAYYEAANKLAAEYPNLVSAIDTAGNATINLTAAEQQLAAVRQQSINAAIKAAKSAVEVANTQNDNLEKIRIDYANKIHWNIGDLQDINEVEKNFIDFINGLSYEISDFTKNEIIDKLASQTDETDTDQLVKWIMSELRLDDQSNSLLILQLQTIVKNYKSINTAENNSEYNQIISQLKQAYDYFFGENKDFTKGLDIINKLTEKAPGFSGVVEKIYNNLKNYISAVQNSEQSVQLSQSTKRAGIASVTGAYLIGRQQTFLTQLVDSSNMLVDQFYTELGKGANTEKYNNFLDSLQGNLDNKIDEINKVWVNLSSPSKEGINSLIKNAKSYNETSFRDALEKYLNDTEATDDLFDIIVNSYFGENANVYTVSKFGDAIGDRNSKRVENEQKQLFTNFQHIGELGETQLRGLLSIWDRVAKAYDNNKITKGQADTFLVKYDQILGQIQNKELKLSPETQAAATKLITNWNDFSIAGLIELSDELKDLGIDDEEITTNIKKLQNYISINLVTEFETFTNKIIQQVDDFGKALSNAEKGMDPKAALEMANKLDLTLDNFIFKDGKYYFKDIDKLRKRYLQYKDQLQIELENYIKSLIDEEDGVLSKIKDVFEVSRDFQFKKNDKSSFVNQYKYVVGGDTNAAKLFEIYQDYWEDFINQRSIEGGEQDFGKYVSGRLGDLQENYESIIKEYGEYTANSLLITSGQISEFVKTIIPEASPEQQQTIIDAIASGDFNKIPQKFRNLFLEYYSVIIDTFSNINKQIYQKIIAPIGSRVEIAATPKNTTALEKLATQFKGYVNLVYDAEGELLYAWLNSSKESLEAIQQSLIDDKETFKPEERRNLLDTAFNELYVSYDSAYDAITKDITDISRSDLSNFAKALNFEWSVEDLISDSEWQGIIQWDEDLKKYYVKNIEEFISKVYNAAEEGKLTDEAAEKYIGQVKKTQYQKSKEYKIRDIIKNYNKLSEQQVEMLQHTFKIARSQLHQNADHTYAISLTQIRQLIETNRNQISNEVEDLIYETIDAMLSNASTAANLLSQGTTSVKSAQQFVTEYKTLLQQAEMGSLAEGATLQSLFDYDKISGSLKLTSDAYSNYIKAQIFILKQAGYTDQEISKILQRNTQRTLEQAIDISGYLSSARSIADKDKLKKSLVNAYSRLFDNIDQLNSFIDEIIQGLDGGGSTAVSILKSLAERTGKTLTQNEIQQAYYRSYEDITTAIGGSVGTVVTQYAADFLKGIEGYEIDESSGVPIISAIGNVSEAWRAYHSMLANSAHKTADILEAATQTLLLTYGDMGAAQTIGKAASMSTADLQALFEQHGLADIYLSAVESWIKAGWAEVSNGQIRILDQNLLATYFNWDSNSDEYLQGLKTYRTALLDLNKKVKTNIESEVGELSDLFIGDQFNLTYLTNQLSKVTFDAFEVGTTGRNALEQLGFKLTQYGAYIQNGVLTITGTNTLGVLDAIKSSIQERLDSKQNAQIISKITSAINNILTEAVNAFSTYNGSNTRITGETANILATFNNSWAEQLSKNGQIVLTTAQQFVDAASIIYSTVSNSYKQGYSNLQQVNSSYSSLIKNGLILDTSAITALSSGMNLTVETLNNFFTSQGKLLEDFLDINGDVKVGYLKRTGYDSYQITDWDYFIDSFGETINKFSKQYIDAYTNYLSGKASSSKDSVIASIIPNLNKLSIEQIKSIASSFGTTVEQVMKYLTDNGDGTYKATNGEFLSVLLSSAGYKNLNELPSFLSKLYVQQLNEVSNTFVTAITSWASSGYKKSGESYVQFATAYEQFFNGINILGVEITNQAETSLDNLMQVIENGGIKAVNLMNSIASIGDIELNQADIKSIYRGKTDKYITALSNLVVSPGQIIDQYTAEILNAASAGSAEMISQGQYIVTSVVNLYDAYLQALKKITSSSGATLEQINSAAAKVLGSRDGQQTIIEAVSSASSMTWETFANIMTQAGISLVDASGEINEEFIEALTDSQTGIIEQLGGDKIRIKDFETFAAFMGWEANSEQYISAFKSYNDAMVALNKKTENDIAQELQNVASAKAGDYINLTSFYSALGKQTVDIMNRALIEAGAYLDKGILKLGSDFRILETINILSTYARNYGIDESQIASLYDTIRDSIESYISDIKAALTGGASNAQTLNIKSFSQQLGLSGIDLTFTETANGLKLSKESAIELYQALSQIDSQVASLMFEDLADTLTEAGSGLQNISATTAKIAVTKREIDKAHTQGRQAQAAALQKQLSLYEKIAAYQKQGADSYSFMDNKLPQYLQGPKNYWESVRKAYEAINKAAEGVDIVGGTKASSKKSKKDSGTTLGESAADTQKRYLMEIEDYYNIVTELGNLAQITGTDLVFLGQTIMHDGSTTAALIEKGLGALTNIDGESTKIDLGKIGFNIQTGAADMKGGFDAALKDMAQSQIDMIDGLINVLEVVVQMEQLGKVDVGDNGVIDLGEIFPKIEGRPGEYDFSKYTQPFIDFSKQIIDLASKEENKDLNEALNKIKLGNQTLFKILEDAKDGIVSADLDPQAFQRLMNSLYQMYLSDNYDLNNLVNSIADLGFQGEITVGETTLVVRNGITLQSDKDGVYTIGGQTTDDPAKAIQLATLRREAELKQLIDAAGNKQYEELADGSIQVNKEIGSIKYTVHVNKEGETTFITSNGEYKTLAQVYDAQWKSDIADGVVSKELSYDAYLVFNGIVKYNLFSDTKSVSVEQAKNLMQTTAEQLRKKWQEALDKGEEATAEFQVKYGFRLDENGLDGLTDDSLKKLIEGQIQQATIKVNTYLGEGAWIMQILKDKEVTINATLKQEKQGSTRQGLDRQPTNTISAVPTKEQNVHQPDGYFFTEEQISFAKAAKEAERARQNKIKQLQVAAAANQAAAEAAAEAQHGHQPDGYFFNEHDIETARAVGSAIGQTTEGFEGIGQAAEASNEKIAALNAMIENVRKTQGQDAANQLLQRLKEAAQQSSGSIEVVDGLITEIITSGQQSLTWEFLVNLINESGIAKAAVENLILTVAGLEGKNYYFTFTADTSQAQMNSEALWNVANSAANNGEVRKLDFYCDQGNSIFAMIAIKEAAQAANNNGQTRMLFFGMDGSIINELTVLGNTAEEIQKDRTITYFSQMNSVTFTAVNFSADNAAHERIIVYDADGKTKLSETLKQIDEAAGKITTTTRYFKYDGDGNLLYSTATQIISYANGLIQPTKYFIFDANGDKVYQGLDNIEDAYIASIGSINDGKFGKIIITANNDDAITKINSVVQALNGIDRQVTIDINANSNGIGNGQSQPHDLDNSQVYNDLLTIGINQKKSTRVPATNNGIQTIILTGKVVSDINSIPEKKREEVLTDFSKQHSYEVTSSYLYDDSYSQSLKDQEGKYGFLGIQPGNFVPSYATSSFYFPVADIDDPFLNLNSVDFNQNGIVGGGRNFRVQGNKIFTTLDKEGFNSLMEYYQQFLYMNKELIPEQYKQQFESFYNFLQEYSDYQVQYGLNYYEMNKKAQEQTVRSVSEFNSDLISSIQKMYNLGENGKTIYGSIEDLESITNFVEKIFQLKDLDLSLLSEEDQATVQLLLEFAEKWQNQQYDVQVKQPLTWRSMFNDPQILQMMKDTNTNPMIQQYTFAAGDSTRTLNRLLDQNGEVVVDIQMDPDGVSIIQALTQNGQAISFTVDPQIKQIVSGQNTDFDDIKKLVNLIAEFKNNNIQLFNSEELTELRELYEALTSGEEFTITLTNGQQITGATWNEYQEPETHGIGGFGIGANPSQTVTSTIDNTGIDNFVNATADAGENANNAGNAIITASDSTKNGLENIEKSANGAANAGTNLSNGLAGVQSGQNRASGAAGIFRDILGSVGSILGIVNPKIQTLVTGLQSLSEISIPGGGGGVVAAKGNVALAAGTLVGQLGPELAVYGGRYHLLGQNGAQMVNLPSDAIVFNHLQTRQLMNSGSTGRGKPITNERNAVSFATGTFGPAMASASAALAALRQIRAMWQSMLGASAKDLGSMAGSNAGGDDSSGGGGGGNDDAQVKSTTAEIERWYNLTRQIDKLQQDITHQQTLRDKLDSDRIANGRAIYESRRKELKNLTDQITATRQLIYLQKSWYDRKREELAKSDYGMIFSYNEEGLQQYTSGRNRGLDILEKLTSRDVTGELTGWAVSAEKQLEYLRSIGFNTDILKYNDDGTIIDLKNPGDKKVEDLYVEMMQNFWDQIDGWKEELDSLYDTYNESYEAILQYEAARNDLLKEIVDNQLAVQNQILTAIEDREQAVIDGLQSERDAIEESAQKFVEGLQEQLEREKKMYQKNQEEEDLNKLRRQILILQRSGGSSSQINSLQDQLNSKEQDAYFNAQQETIDAIQQASDKELERLDAQLDLMTETLEYQKQHGLLWAEVTSVMQQDEQQIMQFIADNKEEWAGYSALQEQEERLDTMKQIQQWTAFRDDQSNYWTSDLGYTMMVNQSIEGLDDEPWATTDTAMYNIFGDTWNDYAEEAKQVFDQILGITGDSAEAQQKALQNIDGTIMIPNGQGENGNGTNNGNSRYNPNGGLKQQWAYQHGYGNGEGKYFGNEEGGEVYQPGTGSTSWLLANGDKGYTDSAWKSDESYHWKERTYTNGQSPKIIGKALHKWKRTQNNGIINKICTVCGRTFIQPNANDITQFAKGGMIDYTGLASVHGSKEAPEAVLTPQQTKFLREDFLSGTSTALNTLQAIKAQWQAMVSSNDITNNNGESVIIEKAQVIMNVNQISNDYDARQAGSAALDEILKVARKSGTRGMSRR